MKEQIDVLHEDDDLILLNKPPNILSIPDRYDETKPNLYNYLQRKYSEIYIVHRLDLETSGVICFAKTKFTHKALNIQFENRSVEKTYLAIVHGKLPRSKDTLNFPLSSFKSKKVRVDSKGKKSSTNYKVVAPYKYHSLLQVQPQTGRTHQIRVHLAHIGHPIVADELYGGQPLFLSKIKKKFNPTKHGQERPLLKRTSLHAKSLELNHPVTNLKLVVEADIPKDMRAAINQMEKNS